MSILNFNLPDLEDNFSTVKIKNEFKRTLYNGHRTLEDD
jgi:hypothetical protein